MPLGFIFILGIAVGVVLMTILVLILGETK
jgi:hypothetical protein